MSVGLHSVTAYAPGTPNPPGTATPFDLSCIVETVDITHGRDDTDSQPIASSAKLSGILSPSSPLPTTLDVGSLVVVTTTTATAAYQRFVGRVTDIALGWDDAGEDTPDHGVADIQCVGLLADLGRRVVGDTPFPQELDGARVSRVMTLAGSPLDPAYSDPGTALIVARDIDSQPALNVAQDAAASASGVVWETRDGLIRYADAMHRKGIPTALTLDACDILVTPTWRRTTEGIVNEVSIGYGVAAGAQQPRYVADNPTSRGKYGRYGISAETALATSDDAAALGQMLLTRNSSPVWVMANLPVDVKNLDDARYDTLLGLDVHALITLQGLPAVGTAPTTASLWVEGWREALGWGTHEVELVVSGYCRTVPPPQWDSVDPAWLWGGTQWTEQRRNVIADPRLVTATGWTAVGPGGVLTQTSGYSPNQPAVTGDRWSVALDFTAPAGATLTGTLAVRGTTGGLFGSNPYAPTNISVPPGQTLRFVNSYTLPPGADGLRLGWVVSDATARIGRAHAEKAATPEPYFDGDTPAYPGAAFAWTGAPAASASTLVGRKELSRNLIPNPNFERDASGWSAYAGVAAPTTSAANPYSGTGRLVAVGAGNSAAPRVAAAPLAGMIAGDVYTMTARLRHDGTWPGGGTAYASLRFQLAPSSETVVASTPVFVPDGAGYMLVTVTGTVPAATNGNLVINLGFAGLASSLTAAGSIGVDEVLLRKSSSAGAYFDGDTPDPPGASNDWMGAPGASPSVSTELALIPGGVSSSLTWDDAACLGPPVNLGRWNDQPASLRWNQVPASTVWNNYGG
jgi:hypothetical protein